jgi:peptide/nickel transport system permease protein
VRLVGWTLLAVLGLALVGPEVAASLGADAWTPVPEARFTAPGAQHWLGTDEQGRDAAARLLWGLRISMVIGLLGAALSVALGTALGVWAGMTGGWVDVLVLRSAESVQAIPKLPLLVLLASIDLQRWGLPPHAGTDLGRLVVLFGLLGWNSVARVVRAQTLALRREPFFESARALAQPRSTLMRRHLLPHLRGPVAVAAAIDFADVVLLESGLSFLGLGVQPPLPSLGALLARGVDYGLRGAWLLWGPGVATILLLGAVGAWCDRAQKAVAPPAHPG